MRFGDIWVWAPFCYLLHCCLIIKKGDTSFLRYHLSKSATYLLGFPGGAGGFGGGGVGLGGNLDPLSLSAMADLLMSVHSKGLRDCTYFIILDIRSQFVSRKVGRIICYLKLIQAPLVHSRWRGCLVCFVLFQLINTRLLAGDRSLLAHPTWTQ